MKIARQQALILWLKERRIIARGLLNISYLLGFISGLLIVAKAWILARILYSMIEESVPREALFLLFAILLATYILRAGVACLRERVTFHVGQRVRYIIRRQVLDRLEEAGPAWIQGRPAGSWSTLILEQIENMHDYYARYLPQLASAVCVPVLIVIAICFSNWIASLILLLTAPLIPLFMTLVGMGAADANRRNFQALARLSGHFLDRLRGMETLRVFGRGKAEIKNIGLVSQDFRRCTMKVLRLALLSSGILEFFTSLSIASVAVYFGFSYLGVLDFGHYNTPITLFSGLLSLMLAPEFFQPLRDLGTFYHAKAQAIGAADTLQAFLESPLVYSKRGDIRLNGSKSLTLIAEDFSVLSPEGFVLAGPLNFTLHPGDRVVLVGMSGSGKTSLLNALSGFMSYTGSLRVNGMELRSLDADTWRTQLSWVGPNSQLPAATLRDNVLLSRPDAPEDELQLALERAWVTEFLALLPNGTETIIGDQGNIGLSAGQIQRIAVARALLKPCHLLLLDEPAANLDADSEQHIMEALDKASRQQTTLMITHRLDRIAEWDNIWVMQHGRIVEQGDFSTLSAGAGMFSSLLQDYYQEDI